MRSAKSELIKLPASHNLANDFVTYWFAACCLSQVLKSFWDMTSK